ncbi:MAG: VOC family protein [Spirochaetota bacterium]
MITEAIDINIPVTNLEESSKFYSELFDCEVLESGENAILLSFEPVRVRLVLTSEISPSNIPVLSFGMDVDDFTEAIQELETANITIQSGPESNGSGETLTFQDPNNNLLEIFYSES